MCSSTEQWDQMGETGRMYGANANISRKESESERKGERHEKANNGSMLSTALSTDM